MDSGVSRETAICLQKTARRHIRTSYVRWSNAVKSPPPNKRSFSQHFVMILTSFLFCSINPVCHFVTILTSISIVVVLAATLYVVLVVSLFSFVE